MSISNEFINFIQTKLETKAKEIFGTKLITVEQIGDDVSKMEFKINAYFNPKTILNMGFDLVEELSWVDNSIYEFEFKWSNGLENGVIVTSRTRNFHGNLRDIQLNYYTEILKQMNNDKCIYDKCNEIDMWYKIEFLKFYNREWNKEEDSK